MLSSNGSALTPASFESSEKEVTGTPQRTEAEFKLPFLIEDSSSISHVKTLVYAALETLFAEDKTKFNLLSKSPYYLDPNFQAFAFVDHYFDTPEDSVLKAKSSYRLRYRWNRKESYLRHRIFPFLSAFNPTRCEIQFKGGYQNNPETNIVEVQESRFEFRNESEPFVRDSSAPSSPWPTEEYFSYMKSGHYKDYRTQPMADLLSRLPQGQGSLNLNFQRKFKLVTFRERMHLNMKHPWGSGPNPEQVFIITIDQSSLEEASLGGLAIKDSKIGKQLLEIEIEIERNTTTEMERISKTGDSFDEQTGPVVALAIQTSTKALALLTEDLMLIRERVLKALANQTGIAPLPADYKYARFSKWLVARDPAH